MYNMPELDYFTPALPGLVVIYHPKKIKNEA